jgi:hypothetical protein
VLLIPVASVVDNGGKFAATQSTDSFRLRDAHNFLLTGRRAVPVGSMSSAALKTNFSLRSESSPVWPVLPAGRRSTEARLFGTKKFWLIIMWSLGGKEPVT